MTASREGTAEPRKLLAGRTVKTRIALASILVLALGAWLAPRAAPTPLSTPQEHAAPLLEAQDQRREVPRPFIGVHEAAAPVAQYSVGIVRPPAPLVPIGNDYSSPPEDRPTISGFGVFVSDTHVLTHRAALAGRSSADLWIRTGGTVAGQVVAYEPPTGLVLLQVQPVAGRSSAAFSGDAPTPGALAVAVGRSEEREFAVPVFITSAGRTGFTIAPQAALLPGMPVFNLAGELLALAAPDGQADGAIPVREAAERLLARAAAGERPSSFGLGFQVATGNLVDSFGADGVLISEVIPGGPAADAGIRAGDVLLAVGETQIDSADTAAEALSTAPVGAPTRLRLRRNSRVSDVEGVAVFAYDIAARAAPSLPPTDGVEAGVLLPLAVIEGSAIPASARVITVNGRRLTTPAQVQRELRAARRPIPVLLRDGRRQFFTAVEPAR